MKKILLSVFIAAGIFFIFSQLVNGYLILENFSFDIKGALKDWKEYRLKGSVEYTLDFDQSGGFVRAKSAASCSALYRWTKVDLKNQPLLSWKWKVLKFPKKPHNSQSDDFAARIYVIFPGCSFGSSEFLEYVWDEFKSLESVEVNPEAKNVRRIVVASGSADCYQWHLISRNLSDDYFKAFGKQPKRKIGILAFMSDSDHTKDKSEAFFDDIKIEYTK